MAASSAALLAVALLTINVYHAQARRAHIASQVQLQLQQIPTVNKTAPDAVAATEAWRGISFIQAGLADMTHGLQNMIGRSRKPAAPSGHIFGIPYFVLDFCLVVLFLLSAATGIYVYRRGQVDDSPELNFPISYEWDQTRKTITVYAKLPRNVDKEVDVVVRPDYFQLGWKGSPPFLDQSLYADIDAEDTSWFVNPAGEFQICFKKIEPTAWPLPIASQELAKFFTERGNLAAKSA